MAINDIKSELTSEFNTSNIDSGENIVIEEKGIKLTITKSMIKIQEEKEKMEMVLSNLKLNQPAKVKKIMASDSVLTKKLLSMGILKGEQVVVTKKSVLGDPIEVTIRGYNLSLRKDEASQVLVEV